jgi:arginine decarboxylase-like protein
MKKHTPEDKIRQRKWNEGIIELLKINRSNLAKIHKAVNVFYAADKDTVTELERRLISYGYRILKVEEEYLNDLPTYWSLEAQLDIIPELARLNNMTDICSDIAIALSCDYDGWFTETVD